MYVSNKFCSLRSLKRIDLPYSVISVGDGAFRGCISLTELRLTTTDNITLDPNTFTGFPNPDNCTLYLHQNKKNGGSNTPAVAVDGKTWGGVVWKSIVYVDDNGATVS